MRAADAYERLYEIIYMVEHVVVAFPMLAKVSSPARAPGTGGRANWSGDALPQAVEDMGSRTGFHTHENG
jgi:hypothetical protein